MNGTMNNKLWPEQHPYNDKFKSLLSSLTCQATTKLAFLVFSGAFNPVHAQHIRAMQVARQEAERLGWTVVAGFLAPASDEYVRRKLGNEAWPLKTRVQLCELATRESDWISVCPWGEFSSSRVSVGLREQLQVEGSDFLSGRSLTGLEIMGSDTTLRIFDEILREWSKTESRRRKPWYQDRIIYCVIRPGLNTSEEKEHIRNVIAPEAAQVGIKIIIVDTTGTHTPLEPVSSRDIRKLVARRDWDELRALGWLQPQVLVAIENRTRE
jgi:nicotinic acid mononucleotide adenylyltransferase